MESDILVLRFVAWKRKPEVGQHLDVLFILQNTTFTNKLSHSTNTRRIWNWAKFIQSVEELLFLAGRQCNINKMCCHKHQIKKCGLFYT